MDLKGEAVQTGAAAVASCPLGMAAFPRTGQNQPSNYS